MTPGLALVTQIVYRLMDEVCQVRKDQLDAGWVAADHHPAYRRPSRRIEGEFEHLVKRVSGS